MIDRLIVFGATGDLAGRFLFPALAELYANEEIPEGFTVFAAARQEYDDDTFRNHVAGQLEQHATDIPRSARDALLRHVQYRTVDLEADDRDQRVRDLLMASTDDGSRPVAAYLALPPRMFVAAAEALGGGDGLPPNSRVVVEKPFGDSLESAIALNRLLERTTGDESAAFRVDHVLGMATVHNLLGVRLANRIFEPVWNSAHIERVEILWEETLALEGRAGYYDRAGALKDVMQNHMLQILSLIAMEPPAGLGERDLRDRKVEALRTVRSPDASEMTMLTQRARYTAGTLAATGGASGANVPDYAAEDGVDPARRTETFAEVVLELESPRWSGTPFVLRAGKALRSRWKGVIVRFRPMEHIPFDTGARACSELRIGLDGPESLELRLNGSAPGPPPGLVPLSLATALPAAELRAYSQVLLDVFRGDCTLSIRGDEAEEAWRIMTPLIEAWAQDMVPLQEYPAGSRGPPRLDLGRVRPAASVG